MQQLLHREFLIRAKEEAAHRALEATPVKAASMCADRAILDREPGGLAREEAKKGSDEIPGATIVASLAGHQRRRVKPGNFAARRSNVQVVSAPTREPIAPIRWSGNCPPDPLY